LLGLGVFFHLLQATGKKDLRFLKVQHLGPRDLLLFFTVGKSYNEGGDGRVFPLNEHHQILEGAHLPTREVEHTGMLETAGEKHFSFSTKKARPGSIPPWPCPFRNLSPIREEWRMGRLAPPSSDDALECVSIERVVRSLAAEDFSDAKKPPGLGQGAIEPKSALKGYPPGRVSAPHDIPR
jgi:hypothetical protein